MIALILNAGMGSRLGEYTKNNPKCMVNLHNSESIIKYQLRLLKQAGINDVIVGTGYMQNLLKEHLQAIDNMSIEFSYNPDFQTTNYIKSMDYIREIDEDVLLMHGDLVFESSVLEAVINSNESCMIIDKSIPLPEKDFKAVVQENRILAVGIEFFDQAYAAQPLYKLKNKDWKIWKEKIKEFCENGNVNVYAENAFNEVLNTVELMGIDINGKLCSEVDNEQDLINIHKRI